MSDFWGESGFTFPADYRVSSAFYESLKHEMSYHAQGLKADMNRAIYGDGLSITNITEDNTMQNTIEEYVNAIQMAEANNWISDDEAKAEARKLFSTSREADAKAEQIAAAEKRLEELKA